MNFKNTEIQNKFRKNIHKLKFLILFSILFLCSIKIVIFSTSLYYIEDIQLEFDNPWLYLKAIQTSYPDAAGFFFFDSELNDWCIQMKDEKIYWAHGRLLRKKDAHNWKRWKPYISYIYPEAVPNPKDYPETLVQSLEFDRLIKHRKTEPSPNYTFHSIIYNGTTKKEIRKQLKKINFLNKNIWIHSRIVLPLKRVERKIYNARKKDPEVKMFLKELRSCWGFNWRSIADSGKLSNHSWGSAIDLLPKNYGKKKIYWFWEAENNKKWLNILPHQRWRPPKAVVEAFESEGFIWGGKWELWDNMHFEYRPELLYVRNFLSSESPHKFLDRGKNGKNQEKNGIKTTLKLGPIFEQIFTFAKAYSYIKEITEEIQYSYEKSIDFFYDEIRAEKKGINQNGNTKNTELEPDGFNKKTGGNFD